MKNVFKKVVIVMVLAMSVMMMCGFTYQTEEAPKALIDELQNEGFTQNETKSNLWSYYEKVDDEIWDEHYVMYGYYDTDANIGTVSVYGGFFVDGVEYQNVVVVVQWDSEAEEFVSLSEAMS